MTGIGPAGTPPVHIDKGTHGTEDEAPPAPREPGNLQSVADDFAAQLDAPPPPPDAPPPTNAPHASEQGLAHASEQGLAHGRGLGGGLGGPAAGPLPGMAPPPPPEIPDVTIEDVAETDDPDTPA